MRLFTALDPPPDTVERLAPLQRPDSLDARWTSPEQFHVTIRFIGNVDEETATAYRNALTGIESPPIECVPYGLDVLPSRRNPSVLIVGLEQTEALMDLYQTVSDVLEAEGLEPETRTYRPHVTLARVRGLPARSVHAFLDETAAASLEPFTVDAFHLYESTLTSDGAVHESLEAFSLDG